MLPRARVTTFARDGEREILSMERVEISLDGVARDGAGFNRAAKRRLGERVLAKIPARGASAIVKTRERRRVSRLELWRDVAHTPGCGFEMRTMRMRIDKRMREITRRGP